MMGYTLSQLEQLTGIDSNQLMAIVKRWGLKYINEYDPELGSRVVRVAYEDALKILMADIPPRYIETPGRYLYHHLDKASNL